MKSKYIKIVMWGTFDTSKPRVRIIERGLRENGVELIKCHSEVWRGIKDKSQIKGVLKKITSFIKWLSVYPLLIYRYMRLPKHDAVLISYLGHLDVLLLWFFAKLRGTPIIWDTFLSIYNTIVEDRRILCASSPIAKMIWNWEWLSCRAADLLIFDTHAHAGYFSNTFQVPREKIAVVFVGAEQEAFPPLFHVPVVDSNPAVLFYGQFIPLHGIETIIQAARIAQNENIDWILIGTGQEECKIRALLNDVPLPKLNWLPWVNYEELSIWLSKATVCLGIFGDTDKATRVIPNKVFQIIMSAKPLITRDSPAIRELIRLSYPDIILVPPANPKALLNAVRKVIYRSPCTRAYHSMRERICPQRLGEDLLTNITMQKLL